MNFEVTTVDGATRTREIVTQAGVDEFAWANQWPYADHTSMSEHLLGWAETGDFAAVAWKAEDGAWFTARLLYPGEIPSLRLTPSHPWARLPIARGRTTG
jgi:hypothetical protein